MSRLSKEIRKKVRCPQLDGGIEYGEWCALRLDQRKQIAKLCEEVDVFEDAADKFGKENYILIQQLAKKDKELANMDDNAETLWNTNMKKLQEIKDKDKEIERLNIENALLQTFIRSRNKGLVAIDFVGVGITVKLDKVVDIDKNSKITFHYKKGE